MKIITLFLLTVTILLGQSIEAPDHSLQLLVVTVDDLSDTRARLHTYERKSSTASWEQVFKAIPVMLGRNGMGLGLGENGFEETQEYPLKIEGDGKSPAGIFKLLKIFGYASKSPTSKMPYIQATKDLHCVDDNRSAYYNQIIHATTGYKSHEKMLRSDDLYKWGIVVGHNQQRIANRGSCIFIHIANEKPTAGCTAMKEKDLMKIITWLDSKKYPVLMQYWSEQ